MARLLVTGGAGFIGTNFVRFWRGQHRADTIVVLDALTYAGNLANLEDVDDIRFVHGDINDIALVVRLLRDESLDTIVHFAAESHVDRSISGPAAFITANVQGTHALLEAAKAEWLVRGTGRPHRFHHISTDEVYGSLASDAPAFTEASAYAPNSPYAASKAASDHLVRAYHRTYGLQTTTTNCSNNYGPFQFPEKLIPLFLINALKGRALPIYGDGLNIRDWLHVEDHCRGIARVLEQGRVGETYNIGGDCERTNLALVDALCTELDAAFAADPALARRFGQSPAARGLPTASLKRFVADRPGHDRRYAIDAGRIATELGHVPTIELAAGLRQTVRWYLANEAWWRRHATASRPPG